MTGSGESNSHGDVTELIGLSPSLPYLSWLILELELERQTKVWQLLLTELQPGKTKTLEQSLKSAAAALKIPVLATHQLCLVRLFPFPPPAPPPLLLPLLFKRDIN